MLEFMVEDMDAALVRLKHETVLVHESVMLPRGNVRRSSAPGMVVSFYVRRPRPPKRLFDCAKGSGRRANRPGSRERSCRVMGGRSGEAASSLGYSFADPPVVRVRAVARSLAIATLIASATRTKKPPALLPRARRFRVSLARSR